MERHLTPRERWENVRKRQLARQAFLNEERAHEVASLREMTPEELMRQSSQYHILSAQQACAENLHAARTAGDEAAVEAWRAVAAYLADWQKEYYARSQQPSRFSNWAAQDYANRPTYNPHSRF